MSGQLGGYVSGDRPDIKVVFGPAAGLAPRRLSRCRLEISLFSARARRSVGGAAANASPIGALAAAITDIDNLPAPIAATRVGNL